MALLTSQALAATLADWATTGGIVVALSGGLWALWRYRADLQTREWSRARASYAAFIDTAIAHPEMVPGYWSSEAAYDPIKKNKFLWYIARFLWAAEEILTYAPPKDRTWKLALQVVISEHADFFGSETGAEETQTYVAPLQALIKETLAALPSEPGKTGSRLLADQRKPSRKGTQRR